jgi:peptidoglycan-N-acetylglucosamine deacetylase
MFKSNSILSLISKIAFFLIVFTSISGTVVFQSRVIQAKSENKQLQMELEEMKKSITELSTENSSLETEIANNQSKYDEAIKHLKFAYLTFDDGPSSHTAKILETLDKHNVKATFFVNYKEGQDHMYKEISKRGHVLANHTASHDYSKIYASKENFFADVKKLDDELERITGEKPSKIFRFPGGSNNTISWNYSRSSQFMPQLAQEITDMGYTFFDWNVDSTDASTFRQEKHIIVSRILADSRYVKHANILMHDLDPKDTTVEALPEIIEGLKRQGFIFDVLSHDSPKAQFTQVN